MADMKERKYWDQYMDAFEELLSHTSTEWAPWYVVPADDRWFARIAASAIIYWEFEKLKLTYPVVSDDQKKALLEAKQELMNE